MCITGWLIRTAPWRETDYFAGDAGDVHGAGKSLLFEEIIKPMYGDYAATLGQSDLESN
ncbi:hypothetical protein J4530_00280 [Neisseria subflava]|uniref:hypothetical protein n=1 Tax=Neisseria subflava TaxID=28449 RepID=UPI00202A5135|nr:hypothetical protein [Neisseria subflava]MCL9786724.1 hypothetical protein [Neisseria subflava]